MNNTNDDRLNSINNMRVLAIILVVFGHSIILYSSSWDLYQTSNNVVFLDYFKQVIDIIPMPLFFAISGYLFFFSHKKYPKLIMFIEKKFKRLIIPFFCVGLLYLLPIRKLIRYPGYVDKSIFEIIVNNFFRVSDVGHLWYLPALFFIFIISELILLIIEKIPYIYKISEIIFILIASMLYLEGYRIAFSYPPLMSAYSYIIWFALGFFLNKWKNVFSSIYKNKVIVTILVLINIILLIYCGLNDNVRLIFNLCVRGLTIINLFELIPKKTNIFLDKLGQNSFGIYLFHSPLVYITFAIIPNASPILVVIINFVIGGVIAFLLTELFRNINLKLVIGE